MTKPKHKHYRKVKQSRFQQTSQRPVQVNEQPVVTSVVAPNTHIVAVKHDLRLTLLTTVGLLAILLLSSYLNTKYHWTLSFGDALYTLLHIR